MKHLLACLIAISCALTSAQDADPPSNKNPNSAKPKAEQKEANKRLRMADELEAQGDLEGAVKILEEISAKNPNASDLLKRIARLHFNLGHFDKGGEVVIRLLEVEGGSKQDYLLAAQMLIETQAYDQTIKLLQQAQKRYPEASEFPNMLTIPLVSQQKWALAIEQFKKALTLAKDDESIFDSSFFYRYGAAQERAGHFDEAEALLKKSLSMIPKEELAEGRDEYIATVKNYLAYMWIDQGKNLDEASTLAKEAAALSPDNGAIADTVGWALFQKKEYARALVELKKAERLMEEPDSEVFLHIGQTLVQLKETEIAADYFRRALKLEPENKKIKACLDQILPPNKEKAP